MVQVGEHRISIFVNDTIRQLPGEGMMAYL
jgi:hypothetical protein